MVRAVRYDVMRQHVQKHFSQMLQYLRERTAYDGPLTVAASCISVVGLSLRNSLKAGVLSSSANLATR